MNFNVVDYLGRDPNTKEKLRLIVLSAFFDYPRCVIEPRHPSSYEYWWGVDGKHLIGLSNYGFRKLNKKRNHSVRVNIVYHIDHWKKITKGQLLRDLLNDAAYVQVKAVSVEEPAKYTEGNYFLPTWYHPRVYTGKLELTSEDFDKKKDCFLRRLLKEKEKDFDE